MLIKSHVKDNVEKGMVVQFITKNFLTAIYSPIYKLHKGKNTSHHILGKELLLQPQMDLKR
jgi:hypothetical protein